MQQLWLSDALLFIDSAGETFWGMRVLPKPQDQWPGSALAAPGPD